MNDHPTSRAALRVALAAAVGAATAVTVRRLDEARMNRRMDALAGALITRPRYELGETGEIARPVLTVVGPGD